jgi:hypothetical protein
MAMDNKLLRPKPSGAKDPVLLKAEDGKQITTESGEKLTTR